MLSVDKFGRWSTIDTSELDLPVGERGVGFLIDKRYEDMYMLPLDKRLLDVADPVDDDNCVNLRYLKENTITNFLNKDSYFDALNLKLVNIGDPFREDESVTLSYLNRIYPIARGQYLSMKDRRMTDVADPLDEQDLINVECLLKALQKIRVVNQDVFKKVLDDKDCPKNPDIFFK